MNYISLTKSYLKGVIGIDTSIFAKHIQTAASPTETTPVDLSKIINIVKNNVVQKTVYDELVQS